MTAHSNSPLTGNEYFTAEAFANQNFVDEVLGEAKATRIDRVQDRTFLGIDKVVRMNVAPSKEPPISRKPRFTHLNVERLGED